jgi:hypothetical protein
MHIVVDHHVKNSNLVIDHVNIRGHLKILNFKFSKYENFK